MKALIIVDVQNDFIPGGALEVPEGNKIIPVINRIQKYFDLVVATQDWHPRDHKSFASNHPGHKPFENINLNGLEQTLWPDHCVQGTSGAELNKNLEKNKIAAIFRKGMNPDIDSYSGFYDNGHKINTGLSGYLKDKEVTDLYFCGLAAEICVYYTIKDSINEGFVATLIEDAARPLILDNYKKAIQELKQLGVHITNSESDRF
jgi:nicotinamidase/pyrazinamidase